VSRPLVAPSRDSGIERLDEFVLRCSSHIVEEDSQTIHESFDGFFGWFDDEAIVSVVAEVPSQIIEAFPDVGDFRFCFRQLESANLRKELIRDAFRR